MTEYDPVIIAEFANRLYRRATTTVALCTVVGLLLGLPIAAASTQLTQGNDTWQVLGFVCGLLIPAILGYAIGRERAFSLRLQAQTALCQMKIEENTRQRPAAATGHSAGGQV